MFSEMTNNFIQAAINAEFKNAQETYGPKYNSMHEGYAVLKEEVEEAMENQRDLETKLSWTWNHIRRNTKKEGYADILSSLEISAKKLAMEAVQVAAVIKKLQETTKE